MWIFDDDSFMHLLDADIFMQILIADIYIYIYIHIVSVAILAQALQPVLVQDILFQAFSIPVS